MAMWQSQAFYFYFYFLQFYCAFLYREGKGGGEFELYFFSMDVIHYDYLTCYVVVGDYKL